MAENASAAGGPRWQPRAGHSRRRDFAHTFRRSRQIEIWRATVELREPYYCTLPVRPPWACLLSRSDRESCRDRASRSARYEGAKAFDESLFGEDFEAA